MRKHFDLPFVDFLDPLRSLFKLRQFNRLPQNFR